MIFIDYSELYQIVQNCLELSPNVTKMDAIWGAHVFQKLPSKG